MTIKQYGSLSLDLNDIKCILIDFNSTSQVYFKNNTTCTFNGSIVSELWKDYQEFTKTKVIKEAFDYVFETDTEPNNFHDKGVSFGNLPLKIFPNGEFNYNEVTGQIEDFNFDSTFKAAWIRYAQDIKDVHLNSIVDPVKVANQVLKFRKLDKEWWAAIEETCLQVNLMKTDNTESLILFKNIEKNKLMVFSLRNSDFRFKINVPTTNSEWRKTIEFVLDCSSLKFQRSHININNWEQQLEDLFKLNQNLKELEQSLDEASKASQNAQRTKNLNVSTPTTQKQIEDFWAD